MCNCARANNVTEINYKPHFLTRKLITFTLFLSPEHIRGQVEYVPVCNLILMIFSCVVLRKLHVHLLFTLETVGFPECLLFLDSDKQLNQ